MTSKKSLRCRTLLGVFVIGGLLYNVIEILWRGYTHWSMFFLGGACFPLIGVIHERLADRTPWLRCTLSALTVTALEYGSGCLVNLKWHMRVWDYSHLPLNVNGQVCLLYSVLWGLLSLAACPVYQLLCMKLGRDRTQRLVTES